MRRSRDRGRLPELRQAINQIEEELAVARLEVAGASAGPGHDAALLRVVPVASSDEWAEALVGMYAAWAERTGRVSERMLMRPDALRIEGLSTFQLLICETGLHKRVQGDQVTLARVVVERMSNGNGAAATDEDGGAGEIVRIYSEGRRQFVRDPRSGV